jgi:glycine dehydrogenase subunit 1
MRYLSNTPAQQREMLDRIGVASVEDLLAGIPAKARLSRPLAVPAALAEPELVRQLRRLAAENAHADAYACFLGAGAYDHAVPSPINHLILRGEFFTAYTPYQPEASQGTLRTIFEYQTMMAELYAMDVANASMYDGGSALAEAVLMAASVTGRRSVLLSQGLHPLHRQVVETYAEGPGLVLRGLPLGDGVTDLDALGRLLTEETAAVVVQYPNFFGCLEDLRAAAQLAHARGALLVVSADPVNLGLLTPPGAMGADIAVGEGQGLGVPLSFGGPNLGVLTCRQELVRRMPGRLVGATVDLEGARGFVLTLQTREQHIRRERATSNICTNVALCALMATIYLAILGKVGLRRVGELSCAKAHYAAERLTAVPGVRRRFGAPFFKEFALDLPVTADRVVRRLLKAGILAGVPLGRFARRDRRGLLVAVTEQRTREEIDAYAAALAAAVGAR